MKHRNQPNRKGKLIICLTGMPGAGKSTAAKAAEQIGFEVLNMGDGIREETIRRGHALTDDKIGEVMMDLRSVNGMGAIANIVLPKITRSKNSLIAVDGVRNIEETEIFQEAGLVKIMAIHAAPYIRFQFLIGRGRKDAPESWESFRVRDDREISVGVGRVMAFADEIISNNDISIEELEERVRKILKKWIESNEF